MLGAEGRPQAEAPGEGSKAVGIWVSTSHAARSCVGIGAEVASRHTAAIARRGCSASAGPRIKPCINRIGQGEQGLC